MTRKELEHLISLGEGLTVELKRSVPGDLGREICAFANTMGGRIVIGVDDHGLIVGVQNLNRAKSEVQSIARNMDPPLAVDIEAVDNTLVITVPSGPSKPYMVGGKFFIRDASSTQQLLRDEIREFFFKEGLVTFDEQPCRRFDLKKDFDQRKYRAFVKTAGIPADMKQTDVLTNLHVIEGETMTNAGVLLFARHVSRFFIDAKINCAHFQGTEKTKILGQQICEGGVVEVYDCAMSYLKAHLDSEYVIRGGPREEVLELPESALREAILNAIAHRDYRLTGHTQIHIFHDRVEITNPGGLVTGLKVADLGRVSRPRNHLLFGLMHRLELVENVGSGIGRIRREMKRYGLQPPLLESGENWFCVTFKRKDQNAAIVPLDNTPTGLAQVGERVGESIGEELTSNQSRIMEILADKPRISAASMALQIAISPRNIEQNIKILRRKGRLKRIGPDRGGWWEVNYGFGVKPANDKDNGRVGSTLVDGLADTHRKILELMRENPRISGKDLARSIGMSDRAVRKHLSRLQADGLVKRVGPDRGGYWNVECQVPRKVPRKVPRNAANKDKGQDS